MVRVYAPAGRLNTKTPATSVRPTARLPSMIGSFAAGRPSARVTRPRRSAAAAAAGSSARPIRSARAIRRVTIGRTPALGPDDLARQDADVLHLGLDAVAGLEEAAAGRAHALGGPGGDDVAGQERHSLGEHLDALGH